MTKIKYCAALILISFFFAACSNDDLNHQQPKEEDPHFINDQIAEKIAINLNTDLLKAKNSTLSTTNEITEITPIEDENCEPLFYIINYKNGGFVVISADNRTTPILAFSDYNNFSLDNNDYPTGLVDWLLKTKNGIQAIRIDSIEQTSIIKQEWEKLLNQSSNQTANLKTNQDSRIIESRIEPPSGCEDELEIVGSLISTNWHQGPPFNTLMPILTCDGQSFQALAGCVPIAVAQVMKYHQHPTNYNWSNMPNYSATSDTYNLIKDIHDNIGIWYYGEWLSKIEYKCNGTGVPRSFGTHTLFTNAFNYTSANSSNITQKQSSKI
ncbi:Spi family protease inhibitor [Marinifilum fragile]|uniref:Spi family protease inhibitor n=1 Tax=Marinifilum fragile TaxID=570161 RepID=UPI002D1E3F5F|nr:Spi family protease inhibitor [Marinifilum fragile]